MAETLAAALPFAPEARASAAPPTPPWWSAQAGSSLFCFGLVRLSKAKGVAKRAKSKGSENRRRAAGSAAGNTACFQVPPEAGREVRKKQNKNDLPEVEGVRQGWLPICEGPLVADEPLHERDLRACRKKKKKRRRSRAKTGVNPDETIIIEDSKVGREAAARLV